MTFHILWTIILLLLFLGVVAWAWSARRRQDFTEAANLPLEDDVSLQDSEDNDMPYKRG